MNLYEDVKTHVTVSETTGKYGLEIECHHKGVCPFYDDQYPWRPMPISYPGMPEASVWSPTAASWPEKGKGVAGTGGSKSSITIIRFCKRV